MSIPVGELVILQNAGYHKWWDGHPAVIVGKLQRRTPIDMNTLEYLDVMGYRVKVLSSDGKFLVAQPYQVRRLRGPDDARAIERVRRAPRVRELEPVR